MFLPFYLIHTLLAAARREEGQQLVEYALIISLVAILIVAGMSALTASMARIFANIVASFGT